MLKNLILKFKWWQLAIYEIGLICFGIVLGLILDDFLNKLLIPLAILAIICLAYIFVLLVNQLKR